GMPEEWLEWLRAADISFQEREQNPELVIEVLQCYDTAKHCARRQKFIMTEDSSWGKHHLFLTIFLLLAS
ncbi:unnamed protein product, partial [Heterobilharzia americana]